jgi:hypothetical protein
VLQLAGRPSRCCELERGELNLLTRPSRLGSSRHTGGVQALSPQNRLLGLVGAVESGFGLWYFTNGHFVNGIGCTIAVAFLAFVYVGRQRKLRRQGGRRY